MKKILLIGNPNVGKSVLFSRLTGVDVIASNYPGTTVEFTKGYLKFDNETYEVIDVPGTYTLEPTNKAEEVAVNMLEDEIKNKTDFFIINIIDATNLERNLNLTLQLINKKLPMILILNFWDEVVHKGISIDYKKLEEIFGVPVVPICARSGEGIKELIQKIKQVKIPAFNIDLNRKWDIIGEIVDKVQKVKHRHHSFSDMLSEISILPTTGIPIAFIILVLTFFITRFIGESLITHILDPLFNNLYMPVVRNIVIKISNLKSLHDILLGTTAEPMSSFGILTTGVYIPLVVVLPYIIAFYIALGVLEDTGYLPRLAVMFDTFMHKMGVHGYSSIPILLGFGCKVPGILATRILETNRQKVITTVLILMIAPCMPQSAMIVSLLLPHGSKYVFLTFLIIFLNGLFISVLINKLLPKKETPELFLEIPPYRMLYLPAMLKKLYIRIKQFLTDAVPLIFAGIILINIFDITGINNIVSSSLGVMLSQVLSLPQEVSSVVILGFLRKDVSIALLAPFKLSITQKIVASIFMTLYLPCASTFFIVLREHGIKNALMITSLVFISGTALAFFVKEIIYFFL